MKESRSIVVSVVFALISHAWLNSAFAEEAAAPSARPAAKKAEKVNVDALKQKYWEKADDSELRIVQNRQFTKDGKLELQLFGGFLSSDPFLSVKAYGLGLGYHFTEHFGFGMLYMKHVVSRSSALERLEAEVNRTANTNAPNNYLAGEFLWSPIYGKLSFLGESIIHYDFHFVFGGGPTKTINGNYFSFHAGLGQQVYLGKRIALKIDYRLIRYSEQIVERANPLATNYNQVIGTRTNYTDAFTIGLGLFL